MTALLQFPQQPRDDGRDGLQSAAASLVDLYGCAVATAQLAFFAPCLLLLQTIALLLHGTHHGATTCATTQTKGGEKFMARAGENP
jgi:hypothetical protein